MFSKFEKECPVAVKIYKDEYKEVDILNKNCRFLKIWKNRTERYLWTQFLSEIEAYVLVNSWNMCRDLQKNRTLSQRSCRERVIPFPYAVKSLFSAQISF